MILYVWDFSQSEAIEQEKYSSVAKFYGLKLLAIGFFAAHIVSSVLHNYGVHSDNVSWSQNLSPEFLRCHWNGEVLSNKNMFRRENGMRSSTYVESRCQRYFHTAGHTLPGLSIVYICRHIGRLPSVASVVCLLL